MHDPLSDTATRLNGGLPLPGVWPGLNATRILAGTRQPHCPRCKGKPTAGQRKLTEAERDSLTGAVRRAVEARFATAFVCKACGTVYSFQAGFSIHIARLRSVIP